MNVNCSTCLELLTPSAELSSAPCGHVFHTTCILQWMETGKNNCPQCRTKCLTKQLRRIYFTEGVDITSSSQDSAALNDRVDSLTFQVRCLETEKKNACEERDKYSAQATALREELRSVEQRLSKAKEQALDYKAANSMLQGEKRKADKAKAEATELREKMDLMKNIEFVVNASAPEVNNKLHQMGDYSKASRELSYVNVTLKKELEEKSKEASHFRKECSSRQRKLDEYKSRAKMLEQSNEELMSDKAKVEDDNRCLEGEIQDLRNKLSSLEEALNSPTGDARQSVINRLIREHPAPLMTGLDDDVSTTPDHLSGNKRKRSDDSPSMASPAECGIWALKKTKSLAAGCTPFKDSTNSMPFGGKTLKTVKPSFSQPSTHQKTNHLLKSLPKLGSALESPKGLQINYDGLGGHSKADNFPVPKVNKINSGHSSTLTSKSKKPKGVSRPKFVSPPNSLSRNDRQIDTFFTSM